MKSPPRPTRCSVLLPNLSIMRAETNVMEELTAPVASVAYWEMDSERPALSKMLVEYCITW